MPQWSELAGGVIHDIGYRRYAGPRLGRAHAVLALYAHGLRGAFGLGRPIRSKLVPVGLLALTCAPAIISAAITVVVPVPVPLLPYAHYPYYVQVPIVMFVAAQAPQLVTSDLRFGTLTLYLARPLRRSDYVWARLASLTTAVLVVIGLPLAVLYAAALLTQVHSAADAVHESGRFLAGLGGAIVGALLLSALALAVSALTRVRAFAIVAVMAVYLVTSAVVAIVQGIASGFTLTLASAAGVLTPFQLLDGFGVWAFRARPLLSIVPGTVGWAYGLATGAVVLAAMAALHGRYRRVRS